jgi:hypothetical protein
VATPRARSSDSVAAGCCFISGEGEGVGVGVGVVAGQGVDATDGVVQDDAMEARSDGAAHVESLPAGSTHGPTLITPRGCIIHPSTSSHTIQKHSICSEEELIDYILQQVHTIIKQLIEKKYSTLYIS